MYVFKFGRVDDPTAKINSLDLLQLITTAGTFWMYSVFCAFAAVFVVMVVPETRNLDLDSIAKLFGKNSSTSPDVPATMIGGDKTDGHPDATNNTGKATSIELHVPVPVPASNATSNSETHKSHANLEITKM